MAVIACNVIGGKFFRKARDGRKSQRTVKILFRHLLIQAAKPADACVECKFFARHNFIPTITAITKACFDSCEKEQTIHSATRQK
jgi:hypothetical protein